MKVVAIPRWVWLLVGLVLGAGIGHARQLWRAGDFSRYGVQIKGQGRFESSLVEQLEGGARAFEHIVVYPEVVAAANGRETAVEIVTGRFHGIAQGADARRDGANSAEWRQAYYIVEPPYRGLSSIASYLASLKPRGVTYTFAWWQRPLWWNTLHVAAGLVTIGLVWPTLINLIAFGSWRRPVQERTSLRRSSGLPTDAPVDHQVVTAELDSFLSDFQGEQSNSAQAASTDAPLPDKASSAPVQILSAGPLQPGEQPAVDSKEFGTGREDYYPTELKAPKHPSSKK